MCRVLKRYGVIQDGIEVLVMYSTISKSTINYEELKDIVYTQKCVTFGLKLLYYYPPCMRHRAKLHVGICVHISSIVCSSTYSLTMYTRSFSSVQFANFYSPGGMRWGVSSGVASLQQQRHHQPDSSWHGD